MAKIPDKLKDSFRLARVRGMGNAQRLDLVWEAILELRERELTDLMDPALKILLRVPENSPIFRKKGMFRLACVVEKDRPVSLALYIAPFEQYESRWWIEWREQESGFTSAKEILKTFRLTDIVEGIQDLVERAIKLIET